jgi:hypothetical protein
MSLNRNVKAISHIDLAFCAAYPELVNNRFRYCSCAKGAVSLNIMVYFGSLKIDGQQHSMP